jgi:hypothetical protein
LTPFILLHNMARYVFCLGMPPVPKNKTTTQSVAGKVEPGDTGNSSAKPVVENKVPWTMRIRRFFRSVRRGRSVEKGIPCVQCKRLAFPIEGTARYRCWSCGCRFEESDL